MGQQSSKSHAPLTFGYINPNQPIPPDDPDTTLFEHYLNSKQTDRDRNHTPDFVLEHPHLYQLSFTCQHCTQQPSQTALVEKTTDTPCRSCRQNKRLSLVRRDLADDLNYIDETYYPNIVHYEEEETESDTTSEPEDEDEGWSKLTIGQITPSIPKRLVTSQQISVDLSGKSLIKLSSSIGYLDNLTKLDLSDNQIVHLPKAIGQLKNLRILNASKNQLQSIPDTIVQLVKLKAVNFSQNKLDFIPKEIGSLPSLIILILNNNNLTQLPRELANLNDLITLNVSYNPLTSIPSEIATLKTLRKLIAEECPFQTEFTYDLRHDPPSLFEFCARHIVKQGISLPPLLQHHPVADYFKKEQTCSFCFGPYFDSHVTRGKFIERTGRQVIALDYQLCCAHWTDESDRFMAMFSTPYYRHDYTPKEHEIVTDGLNTPMTCEETNQQDYFSTMPTRRARTPSEVVFSSASSSSDPFLSLPSSSRSRPRSQSTTSSPSLLKNAMHQNMSLVLQRQQQENDVVSPPFHHDEGFSENASSRSSRVIKQGFASLGARLGRGRDRSDTF